MIDYFKGLVMTHDLDILMSGNIWGLNGLSEVSAEDSFTKLVVYTVNPNNFQKNDTMVSQLRPNILTVQCMFSFVSFLLHTDTDTDKPLSDSHIKTCIRERGSTLLPGISYPLLRTCSVGVAYIYIRVPHTGPQTHSALKNDSFLPSHH